ncbi:DUF4381 domain-containing protein [Roseibacterium sp. SDUM158016]|jgi:hypothetical protein|uniref:DUF4381 domain-containing protein n=1 Tax=Roseicyclus sediminis TaxID=2980997 RepID=UPI0021D3E13B|nr:DUF4381 domain-containing protein [Roseibacterium sp. SDUM158016]MCU4653298.1 DUF4381 domain-containing protein [Roseibacterium sp. SDUM158016]
MTPLSPEQQAALEQLRDIRLPEPVGWWPLAPGWWGLIALLLLLVAGGLTWRVLRRRTRRYAALRELSVLRDRLETEGDPGLAAELAALVRRVALSAQGRHLARLSDRAWIEALAEGPGRLPPEVAALIAEAPYRRPETLEAERPRSLLTPTERWIRRVA